MGMGLDARVCADSPNSCKMLVTGWKKQIEGTLASATSRCQAGGVVDGCSTPVAPAVPKREDRGTLGLVRGLQTRHEGC